MIKSFRVMVPNHLLQAEASRLVLVVGNNGYMELRVKP